MSSACFSELIRLYGYQLLHSAGRGCEGPLTERRLSGRQLTGMNTSTKSVVSSGMRRKKTSLQVFRSNLKRCKKTAGTLPAMCYVAVCEW